MMWLVIAGLAQAASCENAPPLDERVASAWAQYNDAEVEAAKDILQEAYQELVCPQAVLTSSQLLDFYRLDALVSISQSDQKEAIYATIRAVGVDHAGAVPPEAYGPHLAELYAFWSSRLNVDLIEVSVDGGGTAYVDGRPVVYGVPVAVVPGEHLIQVEAGGVFRNSVSDLNANHVVATGVPLPVGALLPAPSPALEPAPFEPVSQPTQPLVPMPQPVEPIIVNLDDEPAAALKRRRPLWTFAGAALTAGGAVFALGSASISERNFLQDPYQGFGAGRDDAVYRDAQSIRLAYGLGYGLAAVSGGLLGVGVVGLSPRPMGSGAGMTMGAKF